MDKYINADAIFSMFSRDYMDLKKDLPVRPSEMAVLNIISRDNKKYTSIMIAEALRVSKPMIANHISALKKKGYIEKQDSLTDKRSFYIFPTKKGEKLIKDTRKSIDNELKKIEEKIGTEKFNMLVSIAEEVLLYINSKEKRKKV